MEREVKRKPKETLTGFQNRVILAMVDEMAEMKRTVERNCAMFTALAKSAGVPVEFE